jgi:hypothetical protein
MGTAQADRIWRSFSRIQTTPEDLAERFVARLMEYGLDEQAAIPLDLAHKHRSIAAALSLVAHNADMLDSIRGVLTKSRVPVIGPLPDRAAQRRVRDLLVETIEDAAGEPFDQRLLEDWRMVADVVATAMFGVEPAKGLRLAA